MQRKLIVTLVAAALELYAASAGAQAASCLNGAGGLNGATPVVVGPLNPVDGFPEYVRDSTGLSVQRCLDPNFCFFDPVIPTDPFSLQIGSGGEAFYWDASAVVFDPAGNRILTYVVAAETAFLQAGPNGEPINGSQFPFLRMRFVMGVPTDGTYTVEHPYGIDTFTVTGATGARDVFMTVDKGMTPNSTMTGPVGPFLRPDVAAGAPTPPVGFVADGGGGGVSVPVTGSPCFRNYVQVTGIDTAGRPVNFGGETLLFTDLFGLQGQIYDGKVQTPVNPTRLTFSRSAAGAGQIDAFAASTATASVSVIDGPTSPTSQIPTQVTLDRTSFAAGEGTNSASVGMANPAGAAGIVAISASEAAATTDATTLNLQVVDFVDITQADYDPATGVLSVTASSADLRDNPVLTLRDVGPFTAGNPIKLVTTTAPPAVVYVDSAGGGSATAKVRVISSAAPTAPTSLVAGGITSRTVTLNWTDTAGNESGYRIYTVTGTAPNLVRTQVGSSGPQPTAASATVTGLNPGQTYTFQVEAFNAVGANSSNLAGPVTTLALPVAPTIGTASPAASPNSRNMTVGFTDNSDDETSFLVERATVSTGPWTAAPTAAAAVAGTGGRTFLDTATLNPSTQYFYRVTAVRGVDTSAVSASTSVTTPAAPSQVLAPTFTGVTGTSVTVNWAPRTGSSATGYVVYRTPAGTANFQPITGVLPLSTVSYPDATVTAGTTYQYRVNAVGWTSYTVGTNGAPSANVQATTVALAAPTAATASTARNPVLGWTDQSTGETNYRVIRNLMTVNATTGAVTVQAGGTTTITSTIAALTTPATGGAMSFTEPTLQANNTTIRYDIVPLNGTNAGPLSSVYAITAALPTPTLGRPGVAATQAIAGGGIRVNWTASGTATVGGYEIQRCTGVLCTTFSTIATVNGRNSNTFADTTATAVGTSYSYRLRAVGGVGTGVTPGAFSTTTTRVR